MALYPRAEHGLPEYEIDLTGARVSTRYVAGCFAMMRDFVLTGELRGPYGASVLTKPQVDSTATQYGHTHQVRLLK